MCKSFQSWPSGAPLFRLPHLSTPSLYSPMKYPSLALSSTTQSLLHIRGAWRSLSWVPQPGGWKLLHIPLVYTEILTSFCACTFLRERDPMLLTCNVFTGLFTPSVHILFHKCWSTHEVPGLVREYTFVGSSGLLLHGVFSRVTG